MQILAQLSLIAVCVAGCPTAPFLGSNDFPGSSYIRRPSNAATGGEATYSGYIIFTNISRTLVAAALPPNLLLAPNSAAPDLHPVIFLFGHQRNTKWIVAGTRIPIGDDYTEMMVLIPFVQKDAGGNMHTYAARMYLDDLEAILLGNLHFFYAKKWGTVDELGLAFTQFHNETPYFEAGIQVGEWHTSEQAESELPNYVAIREIFEMPIVGSSGLLGLKCSYFEFHYENAMVAAVQSQHRFLQPFRESMAAWVGLGALSSVRDGAVAIQGLTWRIAAPPTPPCQF